MIAAASEKKKAYFTLFKVSHLFSIGETNAAEKLFAEVQEGKLDIMTKVLPMRF